MYNYKFHTRWLALQDWCRGLSTAGPGSRWSASLIVGMGKRGQHALYLQCAGAVVLSSALTSTCLPGADHGVPGRRATAGHRGDGPGGWGGRGGRRGWDWMRWWVRGRRGRGWRRWWVQCAQKGARFESRQCNTSRHVFLCRLGVFCPRPACDLRYLGWSLTLHPLRCCCRLCGTA